MSKQDRRSEGEEVVNQKIKDASRRLSEMMGDFIPLSSELCDDEEDERSLQESLQDVKPNFVVSGEDHDLEGYDSVILIRRH